METEETLQCVACGSTNTEEVIWRLGGSTASYDMERTLAKYDLNQIRMCKCNACGHEERLHR